LIYIDKGNEVTNVDKFETHKNNCFSEARQAVAERRKKNGRGEVVDRRLGLDRRRGPGKRRSDDRRSAEEGQLTDEQFSFLMAVDEYKKLNNRPFPSWTEILEVIKALGYRKVADPSSLDESDKNEPAEVKA
jgi:hypothetical protein